MPTIIALAAVARSGKDTVASILLEQDDVAAYALADPLKAGCQALFGLTDDEAWSDDLKEEAIQIWGVSPRQLFQRVGTEWLRDHNPDHWLLRADRQLNHLPQDFSPLQNEDLNSLPSPIWLAVQSIWGLSKEQILQSALRDQRDAYWSMTPNEMFSVISNYLRSDFPKYEATRSMRPTALPTRTLTKANGKNIVVIKDIRFENEATFWRAHNGKIWHISRDNTVKVNFHTSEAGIEVAASDTVIENNGTLAELRVNVDQAWSKIHS